MATVARVQARQATRLLPPAAVFTLAVLIHNSDHARRSVGGLSTDVFVAGTSSMFLEAAVVVLIVQRHRLAPLLATVSGFSLAAGYLLVHFLPARSWLSDSFTSGTDVSPISWFAASFEVAAALFLGVTALGVLRERGGLASAARPDPQQGALPDAIRHPLAVAMVLGNAILLVISFAQR